MVEGFKCLRYLMSSYSEENCEFTVNSAIRGFREGDKGDFLGSAEKLKEELIEKEKAGKSKRSNSICHKITYNDVNQLFEHHFFVDDNRALLESVEGKDNKRRDRFIVRTLGGGERFLYVYHTRFEEWLISLKVLIGNIFNNVVRMILIPVLLSPVLAIFAPKSRIFRILKEDLANLMPIKAILGLFLNALIDTLAVLTGGCKYFNVLSGDIVRWVVGDDINKATWVKRVSGGRFFFNIFLRYIAPCQQPMFILSKEPAREALKLSYREESIYAHIQEAREMQSFLRWMVQDTFRIDIAVEKET